MNNNTKPLYEGMTRLAAVLTKCRIALLLRGSRSTRQPAATDTKEIFNHSDPELSKTISSKGLQFIEPDVEKLILKDPALLKYVVHSLIDNAVDFSPEGGTVTLGAHEDGSDLVLAVADMGKGISMAKQRLLFEPFSKVEGYERFDHEGMGFDLYLDRLIMEYLGGNIDLQSYEGQGTTVSLRLPAVS